MKFEYSPGLIGYGAKGADGSAGVEGMGMHYTDYDIFGSDSIICRDKIKNNESLFVSDAAGTLLPGGRSYHNYESIFDEDGNIYKIVNASSGSITKQDVKFSTVTYFKETGANSDDNFEHISNIFGVYQTEDDPSVLYDKWYIIDNVYAKKRIKYLSYPSTIYGIKPKNFNRVEYSNIVMNSIYNPFTVYSGGYYKYENDNECFAIVRDINNNTFRIGNYDSCIGQLRSTTLVFDVSSLKRNSCCININTSSGEIISNKEVSCNTLFTGLFSLSPASFTATSLSTTEVSIGWNLYDFTPDSCITGDLYFYKKITSPTMPVIFHNLESNGTLTITDLVQNDIYYYHISIIKDGWIRNSLIKQITVGVIPIMYVIDPLDLQLEASSNGKIGGADTYTIDFSTNSETGWSLYPTVSWISCDPASAESYSANEQSIITVTANTATSPRTGYIYLDSQAARQTITIVQDASYVPPTPSLSVDRTALYEDYASNICVGYSNTFNVTSNTSWDVEVSTGSGVKILGGTGKSGNGSFTINYYTTSGPDRDCSVYIVSSAPTVVIGCHQHEFCPDEE